MIQYALFARLTAKPGKEQAVADFLSAGLQMANQEATTPIWFALRIAPNVFGIFDAFASEQDRQAHLDGPIAKRSWRMRPSCWPRHPTLRRSRCSA